MVLSLNVPDDASVYINGYRSNSEGSRRRFVSYMPRPGQTYRYVIEVLVTRDGRTVEQAKTVSLQAGGSLVAPLGVELEFLRGVIGLGLETRLLVLKLRGEWAGTLEPGINLRFYFSGVDGSLFLFTGVSFLSLWPLSSFSLDQGILKPRAGLGYTWLPGEDDRWRIGLEIGVVWLQEIIEGDLYDIQFPLVPHLMLALGRTF